MDTIRRVAEQLFGVLRPRTNEYYLEAGIGAAGPLNRILKKHSALTVADFVRFIDDQEVNSRRVTKDVR